MKGNAKRKLLEDRFIVFSKDLYCYISKDIIILVIIQVVASIISKWRIESAREMKGGRWLEIQVK